MIGAVYGTASVVQTVDKYPLYGLLPIEEKYKIKKNVSSDWSIITEASCSPSSE